MNVSGDIPLANKMKDNSGTAVEHLFNQFDMHYWNPCFFPQFTYFMQGPTQSDISIWRTPRLSAEVNDTKGSELYAHCAHMPFIEARTENTVNGFQIKYSHPTYFMAGSGGPTRSILGGGLFSDHYYCNSCDLRFVGKSNSILISCYKFEKSY